MPARTACLPKLSPVLALICLGLVTAPSDADDEGYVLTYRFLPGNDFVYSVNNQSQMLLQQGESEQHAEYGSITDRRIITKSVDAKGNAVLDLQIDRVQLSAAEDGGRPITYDSASDDDLPEMFQGVSETVGKPNVRITVSPRGEVLEIQWLAGGDAAPKPTPDEAAGLDLLVVLPEGPIAVGDTWKQRFDSEVSATSGLKKTITLQREYTLKEVKGDEATIELKTSVLSRLTDPAQEAQLAGKTPRGTIVFDLARGLVVSRTLSVDKATVGFNGPDSKVRNIISWSETLRPSRIAADDAEEATRR